MIKHLIPRSQNKISVYTAIFGNYDQLKEPIVSPRFCDLYCFTDNRAIKSKFWNIIYKKGYYNDSTRTARKYKTTPHIYFPKYEYSIWIDGSIRLKTYDLQSLVFKYLRKHDIALFKHPERNCIYDEINACIEGRRDNPLVMKRQLERYKSNGYPKSNGLVATTILIRKHNASKIIQLDEMWWNEIEHGSRRDQLSFNYVAWKQKLKYGIIRGNLWNNNYFSFIPHTYIAQI